MGNSSATHNGPTALDLTVSQNALTVRHGEDQQSDTVSERRAWDIVFKGNMVSWLKVADQFGLQEYQVDCTSSHLCDRDYICHCYFSVIHKRWKKSLEIIRFKQPSLSIPVGKNGSMGRLLASSFNKNLQVVAVSRHMAVLEMGVGERRHAFPIINTKQRAVVAVYEPNFLLTLVEGEISPDLSRTGLLLYSASDNLDNGHLTFDLFLISNTTGELLSRTCIGSDGIQPHFAFHPSYQWSHIVATHYSKQNRKLAILNIVDESCVCLSSPTLAFIVRYQQLYPRFSTDGRFLLLQKLSDDRFGVTSFCDTYIFNISENTFHLIKYISSKIPGIFHSCRVWYKPAFSQCGQYLRILDTLKNATTVVVYRLPHVLELKSRCRQVIMNSLSSPDFVEFLPVPNKLKRFLLFSPAFSG